MKTTQTEDETLTLDSESIARQLRPRPISPNEMKRIGSEIAERARTRMAANECGGLPGLPAAKRGFLRKLVTKLAGEPT
jgi:hypothetical protein